MCRCVLRSEELHRLDADDARALAAAVPSERTVLLVGLRWQTVSIV
jgi:hypothetical protein